jgi:MFS family permease
MSISDTGYYLGAIRLGGIGTLFLVPFADRIGRRRVFLLALLGMSVGTFATAFAQTPAQFVAIQWVTRAFMLTGGALSVVILVEEFPAEHRGAALGMLAVLGGLGYGIGALVYAAVDILPFGWRFLYVVGVLPLAFLPFFRRALRETRRYEEHRARQGPEARGAFAAFGQQLRDFLRANPRRAAAVAGAGLFASMGSIAVFQYTNLFVRDIHHWAAGQYTLLVLGGGMIGMFGNVIGGRGSDRFGRRAVGFVGLALAPVFAAAFFLGPEETLVFAWGLYVLCMAAGDVVVRAFAAELFPTHHRGTSSGVLIAVQTVGFSAGLFVVGLGTGTFGAELAIMVSLVAVASIAAGICLLFLPETSRRSLESISGEPPEEAVGPGR